jgi:hypothetical protein
MNPHFPTGKNKQTKPGILPLDLQEKDGATYVYTQRFIKKMAEFSHVLHDFGVVGIWWIN